MNDTSLPADMGPPFRTRLHPLSSTLGAVLDIVESGHTTVTPIRKETRLRYSFDSELTFTPKLNEASLKMARERGHNWKESYESRQAAQIAEHERAFTFKPRVSMRSERIAQRLNSTFLSRQQQHVERRRQLMEHLTSGRRPVRGARTLPKTISVTHMNLSNTSSSRVLSTSSFNTSKSLCDVGIRNMTSTSGTSLTPVEFPTDSSDREFDEMLSSRNAIDQENLRKGSVTRSTDKLVAIEKSVYLTSVPLKRKRSDGERHTKHKRCSTFPTSSNENRDVTSLKATDEATRLRTKSLSSVQKSFKAVQLKPTFVPVTKHLENSLNIFHVKRAKEAASIAIREKKVFLCIGPYMPIRQSLRRRGWVEKNYKGPLGALKQRKKDKQKNSKQSKLATKGNESGKTESSQSSDSDSDSDTEMSDQLVQAYREEFTDDEEYSMASRAVRLTYPHFVWTCKRDDIEFRFLRRDQIVSHYQQAVSFTTKVGLCKNLSNLIWFSDTDPHTFFPRCYRLCADDEKKTFIDDFRLTAAVNILKWVVENSHLKMSVAIGDTCNQSVASVGQRKDDEDKEISHVVSEDAVNMALIACDEFIKFRNHSDIDETPSKAPVISDNDWNDLIQSSYQLTQEQGVLSSLSGITYNRCVAVLNMLKGHLPQLDLDGLTNIWIVKPGAKSRGRGIFCLNRLESILELVSSTVQKKENKLIVQKYIERPLLIYETKFDIRQWFLVTDWNPLTMWVYKKCYLRFSTQLFTLDKLDQSVHLCNNSIQKHYENAIRPSELPEENMWDEEQFQSFLSARGAGRAWQDVIYPGMKQALVAVLLTSQDDMDLRKNSFELFGADFMITEDYRPWLIEINSSPAMSASSKVTAKLCPQVMEDTLKVVLDRRRDKNADIGWFELGYKQNHVAVPTYVGMQLVVEGQHMNLNTQNRKPMPKPEPASKLRPQSSVSISGHSHYDSSIFSENNDDSDDGSQLVKKHVKSQDSVTCCPTRVVSPGLAPLPQHTQRLTQKRAPVNIKRPLTTSMNRSRLRSVSLKLRTVGLAVFGSKPGK